MKSKNNRTIFIGDVHGCLHELKSMIELLEVSRSDRVILLGDLINRGPDPAGVVNFVYESGYESLMGNHEYEYLAEHKATQKYKELRQLLGEKLHQWIKDRPLYIEGEDFLAVHAGLQPGKHPSETKPEILLHIRTWDGIGLELKKGNNPPWYELYNGKKIVFYGHWATKGVTIRQNTIGLDSGCVYGKKLSAYILEEKRLVQLDASKQHYIPPSQRKAHMAGTLR